MYAVTDKREIARRAKNLKLRAVFLLKNLVIDLRKTTGIDMHEEIIGYLKERLEEENKNDKRK